jgi:hypothetical protein
MLRADDIEFRFPGLLGSVLRSHHPAPGEPEEQHPQEQ